MDVVYIAIETFACLKTVNYIVTVWLDTRCTSELSCLNCVHIERYAYAVWCRAWAACAKMVWLVHLWNTQSTFLRWPLSRRRAADSHMFFFPPSSCKRRKEMLLSETLRIFLARRLWKYKYIWGSEFYYWSTRCSLTRGWSQKQQHSVVNRMSCESFLIDCWEGINRFSAQQKFLCRNTSNRGKELSLTARPWLLGCFHVKCMVFNCSEVIFVLESASWKLRTKTHPSWQHTHAHLLFPYFCPVFFSKNMHMHASNGSPMKHGLSVRQLERFRCTTFWISPAPSPLPSILSYLCL